MSNSDWAQGFAARLKVLHERFGNSKAEMARQCGLPPRTLENYFKGHKPGIEVLIAISRGLKVDIDWLIGEESDPQNGFNSDMVGEAASRVLHPFLSSIASVSAYGGAPIENGKIFGREPGEIAGQLEAKIREEYIELRKDYALSTLDEAQTRSWSRDDALHDALKD